ncbi:hypothetical protein KI387_006007 [Taxus chinensis]|uniref:Retrotransposon gag domain-containing protein n=1 Tax=Taxus chinensis TaxID=29808 RepID=A0AA38GNZ7_TAXCH|nr:hypothetical protein KI387_006007 [Taxus chinensis]
MAREAEGVFDRTFTYPIQLGDDDTSMKNISPAHLPFRGMSSEDPDQFLFEFKVLCQTYDYKIDNQKLKLFPSTLKDATMRWFMGLPSNSISTWAQMETTFLDKYQDYCRGRNRKEEFFKIKQEENENIEDCLDIFLFVSNRCGFVLSEELSKTIFLKGLDDESREALNLIGGGDIDQIRMNGIKDICRSYSRTRGGPRKGKSVKSLNPYMNKLMDELANFKTDILVQLTSIMDGLQAKANSKTEPLAMYCPRCRKKHALRDCPLDKTEMCLICESKEHDTDVCSLLLIIKNQLKQISASSTTKKIEFCSETT